jgi:hypothetical protein
MTEEMLEIKITMTIAWWFRYLILPAYCLYFYCSLIFRPGRRFGNRLLDYLGKKSIRKVAI